MISGSMFQRTLFTGALLIPLPVLADDISNTGTSSASLEVELQAEVGDSITLTVGGRTDSTTINDPGTGPQIDFQSVAVDVTDYTGSTADLQKEYYEDDPSAAFWAELLATVDIAGNFTTVNLSISGPAPSQTGVTPYWQCGGSTSWTGTSFATDVTAAESLDSTEPCATYTGTGTFTTNVDLALHLAAEATGPASQAFTFTAAP